MLQETRGASKGPLGGLAKGERWRSHIGHHDLRSPSWTVTAAAGNPQG